jgi:uncharacterized membrane protein
MEFLLFLLFVLGVTVLIVLLSFKSNALNKIDFLNERIDSLSDDLKKLKLEKREEKKPATPEISIPHKAPEIRPEIAKPVLEEKEIEPVIETPKIQRESVPVPRNPEPAFINVQPLPPPRPPQPGFFERNPDLEKFIGENLANKIGIGVLVLGIGFFVKYAIDQDWINEIGRVFIGILCGGILLGTAHWLRKKFSAFSSVLVGGGIAILYLTIAIGFHEYKIFSQTAAFIIMLVITGFAVALSLTYNRIELAILSLLGGFASPFMLSTGEGNYVVLFTYILILDVGMLVLAYFKKWNLINIIAYVFTVILFGSWMGAKFDGTNVSMIWGAMIFATLFYFVFFAMNIVNNIKERSAFNAIEISLLLSNTFLYYAAGMSILDGETTKVFQGLFTACLGIFNFAFAFMLYRSSKADKKLVFMLIGLVLTFISLAAPVQLEGNYITLFWAAEAVLLLWLSQKSGIRLMKLASVIVMALMLISLMMDWGQIYRNPTDLPLTIILNKGYITGMFALGSIVGTYLLLKKEKEEPVESILLYRNILSWIGVIILYLANLFELRLQLAQVELTYSAQTVIIGTYNMIFILGMLLVDKKFELQENVTKAFSFLGFVAMASYLIFYHNEILSTRDGYLMFDETATGFIFHYIFVALLIAIAILTIPKMQSLTDFNKISHNFYSWFYVFFFVFLASAELDHIVLMAAGVTAETQEHLLTQNHKIGFPILWGLTSFVLIAVGLKTKKKYLRIISLTLFLVTLIKLFFVDIKGISEGGKIAAFISLGILLLIVSFMYQRLKKLLLDDEGTHTEQSTERL